MKTEKPVGIEGHLPALHAMICAMLEAKAARINMLEAELTRLRNEEQVEAQSSSPSSSSSSSFSASSSTLSLAAEPQGGKKRKEIKTGSAKDCSREGKRRAKESAPRQ